MICPFCHADVIQEGDLRCRNCGKEALPVNECPDCGKTLYPQDCFCPQCCAKSTWYSQGLIQPLDPLAAEE